MRRDGEFELRMHELIAYNIVENHAFSRRVQWENIYEWSTSHGWGVVECVKYNTVHSASANWAENLIRDGTTIEKYQVTQKC